MKTCIILFSIFYFIFTSSRTESNDSAVAYITTENTIVVNYDKAKEKVTTVLGKRIDLMQIKDIEIRQVHTIGEKALASYFIQFSDPATNQRLAKYVFLHEGKFYFYEDIQKEWSIPIDEENDTFYISYYLIQGKTEDECLPNIAFMDGELYWITGTELICAPDSPCKSNQILVM